MQQTTSRRDRGASKGVRFPTGSQELRMPIGLPLEDDPVWFKDAVIYQLHIKAFYDSNGDGYGDIPGLIEKLDYIQDLGINCIWLLPFYPSPLRDDGYDIADYTSIHHAYGTKEDFQRLISEAHKRGIRIMTELVINHTSDQHPWFQAARRAPPGSEKRDYYVWSDSDKKYAGTRIIFTETEKSNWTWDPVAKAYYWHRFFHHQPDLNFDNPKVVQEIIDVMRYWFDMGVDAMRLDAMPYLVEREGTNCENVPETHEIIKTLRQALDKDYQHRVFLAEANQWPADVRSYFGDGDECHMAYHFPLMPRIYMAVHMEDRRPITQIMEQTPDIPETCQWAMFLRNHDELTLEMVTDAERAYMYLAYAPDPNMRINVGIRRRLARLLDHNRRCLELLNNLLHTMPGTPIVYYGDEIGMGDNVLLADRDGLRTPMQWSGDANAGFSKGPFSRLYAPPISDAIDGYQSVNVESQLPDQSSLLNWMKTIIRVRRSYKVFGRGTMQFLQPDNRKVLAYLRKHENTCVLVVSNLSRYAQSAELDLSDYKGCTPVELLGLQPFPRIGRAPFVVTLGPYSFFWLLLTPGSDLNEPDYVSQAVQAATACAPERLPSVEDTTRASLLTNPRSQGDGWTYTIQELRRAYERAATRWQHLPRIVVGSGDIARFAYLPMPQEIYELLGTYVRSAQLLGRRTAELHLALSQEGESERISKAELTGVLNKMRQDMSLAFRALAEKAEGLPPNIVELYERLVHRLPDLDMLLDGLATVKFPLLKIRGQQDYRLSRLLCVDGDFTIWDPGDVVADPEKQKQPVFKGLAGILRSISYAINVSLTIFAHNRSEDIARFRPWATNLERWITIIFLKEYDAIVRGSGLIPEGRSEFIVMLQCFLAGAAFEEVLHEAEHRPSFLNVPLLGLLDLLDQDHLPG